MTDGFDQCVAVTLDYEGGNDDDINDPGGRTSRGIEQREWDAYTRTHPELARFTDVWTAPQSAILDIYRTEYWDTVCGSKWPQGANLVVFDAGVNSGVGKSLVWARASLAQGAGTFSILAALCSGTKDKTAFIHTYQARRLSFLEALRTWQYFGKGWRARVAGIESIATRWAQEAAGASSIQVATNLKVKAAQARDKSNAASGGAAAAPAAPVAHHSWIAHDWLGYTIDVVLVIGAICIVAYLVHLAMNHQARATAFTAEAAK